MSPESKGVVTEPGGFRGIRWGEDVDELPGMVFVYEDESKVKFYMRKEDDMKIHGAALDSISYGFLNGRFAMVTIGFSKDENFNIIKDTFTKLYGGSITLEDDHEGQNFVWKHGPNVLISLSYSDKAGMGKAGYLFTPILENA